MGLKREANPTKVWYSFDLFDGLLENAFVIGANVKFDLAWCKRMGMGTPKKVWDVLLAHYYLNNQTTWPSLNEVAEYYNLGSKLDEVQEYWDKGIETDQIPPDILSKYCAQDVDLTYNIYRRQCEDFIHRPNLYKLFKLACQDSLILMEAEENGLLFDEDLCKRRSTECRQRMDEIAATLSRVYPNIPINFNSGDQLSVFLYGGDLAIETKVQDGFYKTGLKRGQIKWKKVVQVHTLPRRVEPLPKTQLQKEGIFKTSIDVLRKLKGPFAKEVVPLILEYSKLDKLAGTYYDGLIKIRQEYCWQEGYLHPNYNQTATATTRLSSSKPNGQNLSGETADLFITRYGKRTSTENMGCLEPNGDGRTH